MKIKYFDIHIYKHDRRVGLGLPKWSERVTSGDVQRPKHSTTLPPNKTLRDLSRKNALGDQFSVVVCQICRTFAHHWII